MAATFERWLARPSTICFLRRLLASTEHERPIEKSSRSFGTLRRQRILQPTTKVTAEDKHPSRKPAQRAEEWEQHNVDSQKDNSEKRSEGDTARRYAGSMGQADKGQADKRAELTPVRAFRSLLYNAGAASRHSVRELALHLRKDKGKIAHWAQLVEDRHRLWGLPGVLDAWQEMKHTNTLLPVNGSEADVLWPILISAGLSTYQSSSSPHREMMNDILDRAKYLHTEYNVVYHGLYRCIVGILVHRDPQEAQRWHQILVQAFGSAVVDLPAVATKFARSKRPLDAHRCFDAIYKSGAQRNLYDHFIPEFLKHGNERDALRWHRYFLAYGDAPGSTTSAMPSVQRLFKLDGNKSLPVIHRQPTEHPVHDASKAPGPAQYAPLTRSTMSTLVGEAHGISQKNISDPFVAKLFATQAFSLDLVTKALGFFGIEKLGPISVHEMALKSGTLPVLGKQVSVLSRMGIRIDASVYGRLMAKILEDNASDMFQTLLTSDQHPEAYGDVQLQQSLLGHYLQQQDYPSAQVALVALSLTGSPQHSDAWNAVLQHHARNCDLPSALRTFIQMQALRMDLPRETLTTFHQYLLPRRNRTHGPSTQSPRPLYERSSMQSLQFVTNAYMYAATHEFVPPAFWREVLKRYGKSHQWDQLEKLVRWLFSRYSARMRRGHEGPRLRPKLERIFDTTMQRAIIVWAFRDAAVRNRLRVRPEVVGSQGFDSPAVKGGYQESTDTATCEPWARGIHMLKEARDLTELNINPITVSAELRLRLWMLFGPAWSARPLNELTIRMNTLTLGHYIRHANEIWGEKLFKIDPTLLEDDAANHPELMVALFGAQRKTNNRREEKADVVEYARSLAFGATIPQPRNTFERGKLWQRSPFRITGPRGHGFSMRASLFKRFRQVRQRRAARLANSHRRPSPEGTPGAV